MGERRTVRSREVTTRDSHLAGNAIEELCDDALDVLIVRGALPRARLAAAAAGLSGEALKDWQRPNAAMPDEDVEIMGTDRPATPTYAAPRGVSLDDYLASAGRHATATAGVFDRGLNARDSLLAAAARHSGRRPVSIALAADGRSYAPFTVRRMMPGRQIGVHHDRHFALPQYCELAPQLDQSLIASMVVTLLPPQSGGELIVYGVTASTPDAPKRPNGFQYDLEAIEERYDRKAFTFDTGDLFILAAGRCLHRVARVAGDLPRITMGAFIALTQPRDRVLMWS
ncbi:MAG: hypothetical protein JSR67_05015 [Proteobacteria bacterium]|nr:hypothetical protein [Pseudomonadota bacterium]